MSNTQAYIESSSGELRPPAVSRTDEIFDVDVFVDLPNIGKSLASLDCLNVDYGVLISIIMREFAKGLGITSECPVEGIENTFRKPIVVCRSVHCFTSIPINFHPDEAGKVANHRRFLTALRRQHGFYVEEIELDFRGHHICNGNIGHSNAAQNNHTWRPREKGVDVSLVMRVMQQCMSPDWPAGVVIISGDADYRPVLREITMQHPPVRATVAAFTDALSNVYLNGRNCSWEDLIILDPYIFELNSESRK